MSQKYKVDFATFCFEGDVHRLHAPGQLEKQVESNNYLFNEIIIVYQSNKFPFFPPIETLNPDEKYLIDRCQVIDIDISLREFGINLDILQYTSTTDRAHYWKYHVVNHLAAIWRSNADYIVFADNDCWMKKQPAGSSWIDEGIKLLQYPDCFIVSPNDGEPERKTQRMSQQMFLTRVDEFRNADFNQPDWDGNVNVPGGPMPENWAMLEGRMELHCRVTGQYRYVLGPEYRYWHHNRLNKEGYFETDYSKY